MADKFTLKALIIGQDKLSPTLQNVAKNVATLQNKLRKTGLGNLGFKDLLVGGALAAPIIAATKAAMGFESQMADLRTSVNFETPQQFAQMSQDLLRLTSQLPVARDDLVKVAQVGGEARIARDELLRFTESAARMGYTFGTSAELAATQMGKWRANLGLTQDAADALANQLNYLGSNGIASSAQLASLVTSVGPLAKAANLSASQVAALGAAFIQMGADEGSASGAIRSMAQALSVGTLATKKQQVIFKALRLDAAQVAKGMENDAQGTMLRIMTAVSKVAPEKQSIVLQRLFGGDAASTVLPLVRNLDALRERFAWMSDEQRTAGSLMGDYATKAATTQSAMQTFQNRLGTLGVTVGQVLLPPLNEFLVFLAPIMAGVQNIAESSPWLIKGLLGAAAGFTGMRLAVFAAIKGLSMFRAAMMLLNTNPIMLAFTALALVAGVIIANWSTVGPYFKLVWNAIYGVIKPVWDWIVNVVMNYSPLGYIIRNWGPILNFLSALWGAVRAGTAAAWEWVKAKLEQFNPLPIITQAWEPVIAWFSRMWDRIRPFIEPLASGAKWLGSKVPGLGGNARGAAGEAGAGGNLLDRAAGSVRDWSASLPQQAAAQQRVQGDINVRFDNPPAGMTVDKPRSSGGVAVKTEVGNVGRRSLATGGTS
ncbi:phage tail tape measure protein [Paraburkholderia susongensis]|uniref:Phage tail tape measure protein, TP901 family, core region n=1 Tax=Paraburkholderia susongensis TaxID=1515439 RepID=A0A1X7I4P5_9BURK|nr:phage tail tape measure protein [Paraburkholderia susongensis]SMG09415.1 phage tail tape measure protein, TP901 family, core region [Paraburkholderia susongensis]